MEALQHNENTIEYNTTDCSENCSRVILPYKAEKEYYVEKLGDIPGKPVYSFFKRLFDIIVSFVCMVILIIPVCIIAAVIKCQTGGDVFYFQERLGKNGKKFTIVKFKTMVDDAECGGAQWCIDENDSRITKIGRILRKYHIDEVPQLWCIFKGDMSFVGPRPERECFYVEFEKYIHGFSERLKVVPGLTGLAQIYEKMHPEEKVSYDIAYIKKRSLWFDMQILIKTVFLILK